MRQLWSRCAYVELMFPEPPETELELLRVIHEFGQMVRFDPPTLADAVQRLGPHRLLKILNHIGQHGATIRDRYSYLSSIISTEGSGLDRTALPQRA